MVFSNINRDLLPLKAQFFLWNAGTAPIVPFLPTYARQLGFSTIIVGIIYMILPITGMLAKPLFGAVADRYRCHKILFITFQAITVVSFFAIQFIPEIPTQVELPLSCDKNEMFLNDCINKTKCISQMPRIENSEEVLHCQIQCKSSKLNDQLCKFSNMSESCRTPITNYPLKFEALLPLNLTLQHSPCTYFKVHPTTSSDGKQVVYCWEHLIVPCLVDCNVGNLQGLVSQPIVSDSELPYLYQFWAFFFLLMFSWIGMAVVVSVGDAICFGMLGDKPALYGHQRLWGAVGWGVFSVIAGVMIDKFSTNQSEKDYTSVFYLMLCVLLLDMFVSSRLKYSQTKLSASIVRDVGRLISKPRIIVFLIWIITVGFCTGLLWQFLFWHLEDLSDCDSIEWMKTLQGLVMGIQCFGGELPFFFLSGKILKKIGHINAMTLVLFGIAVRFILYSILSNPWWCLPIEFLQGITFGIFYATMASYASIVAPPGTEATIQGLVGASFEGIGVSFGSFIGGILYDAYGGQTTFFVYGIGSLIMFVLHIIVQYVFSVKCPYNSDITDFESAAHYAPPNEAIQILEDDQAVAAS